MKNAKLTAQQAWIISVVVALLAVAAIYFLMIKPGMEHLEERQSFRDSRQIVANDKGKETKRKKDVQLRKKVAEADWSRYDRALMPRVNMADLWTATQQFWTEKIDRLGPMVDKYLMADKSVTVINKQLSLAAPAADPNQVNQPQPFVFPIGSVRVRGTFPNIMRHIRRWNNFNRLVLVDGVNLVGQSPQLEATYSLTIYEWAQNTEKPGPAFPWAGGTGAGGVMGGGGAMGGSGPMGGGAAPGPGGGYGGSGGMMGGPGTGGGDAPTAMSSSGMSGGR